MSKKGQVIDLAALARDESMDMKSRLPTAPGANPNGE